MNTFLSGLAYGTGLILGTAIFTVVLWKALKWAQKGVEEDIALNCSNRQREFIEAQYEEMYQILLKERAKRFSPEPSEN